LDHARPAILSRSPFQRGEHADHHRIFQTPRQSSRSGRADRRDQGTLLDVLHITDGAPPTRVNRTAECSITAGKGGSITTTVTVTTGGFLLVIWAKPD
jgi:hypothetical protein